MMHTVTRQLNTYTGEKVVEISQGSMDYSNPGAYCKKYAGELEEYESACEAVEAAIRIAEAWQKDEPDTEILIDHGATGGMTMFFEGQELSGEIFEGLREWAREHDEETGEC